MQELIKILGLDYIPAPMSWVYQISDVLNKLELLALDLKYGSEDIDLEGLYDEILVDVKQGKKSLESLKGFLEENGYGSEGD